MIAERGRLSEIVASYPPYRMAKAKVELPKGLEVRGIIEEIARRHAGEGEITLTDGVRIDYERSWVCIRKSGTEPVLRVYAEAESPEEAGELLNRFMGEIDELMSLGR